MNDNTNTPQQTNIVSFNDVMTLISSFKQESDKMEIEMERLRIDSDNQKEKNRLEFEKIRLEAEEKTELKNKIYGGTFVVAALGLYTVLLWHGKASEGFGVLITTVVTSSLAGVFKGLIGKKRKKEEAEEE
ncbi:MAG: hypothetical protein ABIN80_20430 [Dyadobacter sp.]|uniref:hypothetical protein n=1 Tax=Dyadobacter sp. TaxID=1914288 RepID=UPI003267314E